MRVEYLWHDFCEIEYQMQHFKQKPRRIEKENVLA